MNTAPARIYNSMRARGKKVARDHHDNICVRTKMDD